MSVPVGSVVVLECPAIWPDLADFLNACDLSAGQTIWIALTMLDQAVLASPPERQVQIRDMVSTAIRTRSKIPGFREATDGPLQ